MRWGRARPGRVRARVWQRPRDGHQPWGHDGLAPGTAPRWEVGALVAPFAPRTDIAAR